MVFQVFFQYLIAEKSFLETVTDFAVLNTEGKTLVMKERLNKSDN